jgi:tetratricopeptide (TPR) repeat protein
VLHDLELVKKVVEVGKTDPDRLETLDEACEGHLGTWLENVPHEMAEQGLVDEALELCDELGGFFEPVAFVGTRGFILHHAGRDEVAIKEAEALANDHQDDAEALTTAAEVLAACGALQRAEELCREVREMALEEEIDPILVWSALDTLKSVLTKTNRHAEAEEVDAELEDYESMMSFDDDDEDDDED